MNRPKTAAHRRGKTHDGHNHVGKTYGNISTTRKALHRAQRRTAAPEIAEELREITCPERLKLIAAGHKRDCSRVFFSLSPDVACDCGAAQC